MNSVDMSLKTKWVNFVEDGQRVTRAAFVALLEGLFEECEDKPGAVLSNLIWKAIFATG